MYRVVHIEANEKLRAQVHRALVDSGDFALVQAADGISGIKRALETSPHIVLTDINLPDLDGYEVTLKLRGELRGTEIPIVAIVDEADREMSLAVGCDGCIIKPLDTTTLPTLLREYIEARREGPPKIKLDPMLLAKQGQKIATRLQSKIEELEETNKRLVEAEKVRSDFYRNLSHELSTPLTPALGYLTMLLREELGPLNEVQRRSLRSIERSFHTVRSVMENLLDMTALATGKMSFIPRHYDFNQFAREAVDLTMHQFEIRNIRLENSIVSDPYRAFGDSDKLKRAMVQLLENAVKFSGAGGRVDVVTREQDEDLFFLVYDSGEGIPEGEIRAIFTTFYQIDGSPTREHGGAGLGLALARKIIERFGGAIWAESPPRDQAEERPWAKTLVALRVPKTVDNDVAGEPYSK